MRPTMVSTNARMVSQTRGITDTPLIRKAGTRLNGERFRIDWLTFNVSPISSSSTNAPSTPQLMNDSRGTRPYSAIAIPATTQTAGKYASVATSMRGNS